MVYPDRRSDDAVPVTSFSVMCHSGILRKEEHQGLVPGQVLHHMPPDPALIVIAHGEKVHVVAGRRAHLPEPTGDLYRVDLVKENAINHAARGGRVGQFDAAFANQIASPERHVGRANQIGERRALQDDTRVLLHPEMFVIAQRALRHDERTRHGRAISRILPDLVYAEPGGGDEPSGENGPAVQQTESVDRLPATFDTDMCAFDDSANAAHGTADFASSDGAGRFLEERHLGSFWGRGEATVREPQTP